MAGGDVKQVQRSFGADAGEQSFDVRFADADAAPPDSVEVTVVDDGADGSEAGGLVAIDVIEIGAGVEARAEAKSDAGGEAAAGSHAELGAEEAEGLLFRVGVEFGTGEAALVGAEKRGLFGWGGENAVDKAADFSERLGTIFFAERVVVKVGEGMKLFGFGAEVRKEFVLGAGADDPVFAGDEDQRGDLDGTGVGDDAVGGFVEAEEDADGDGAGDERVVFVGGDAGGVVGEELGFDVGLDEEIAEDRVHQTEAEAGEGDVEIDAEAGRGKDHTADFGGVIVDPAGGDDAADALGEDGEIFEGDPVGCGDVAGEIVEVADGTGEAGAIAAWAGGEAVAAGVPGEHGVVGELDFIHDVLKTTGVFVVAMEQEEALGLRAGPATVEKAKAVGRFEP